MTSIAAFIGVGLFIGGLIIGCSLVADAVVAVVGWTSDYIPPAIVYAVLSIVMILSGAVIISTVK